MVYKSPAKHYQILLLSKTEFEKIVWLDDEKEMRFNGKLYDVSKIETLNTTIKLFVEEDSMETKLVDDFVAMFTTQADKTTNSSPIKILMQHFMQEFTFNTPTTISPASLSMISFTQEEFDFSSFISIGQSPPPDKFLS